MSEHFRTHAASYVGFTAVVGTVLVGHLQAVSVLETGRLQAASVSETGRRQAASTLEATRDEIAGRRESDWVHEQATRYGELVQASTRMRILMQRFERLDEKSKRDPAIVGELTEDTDDLAAKANSAAVILQSHKSKAVRENSHGIAFTLPYAAQCLETGMPGSANGYRVDYPGKGLISCVDLRKWLEDHESRLAQEPPAFS